MEVGVFFPSGFFFQFTQDRKTVLASLGVDVKINDDNYNKMLK